MSDSFANFVAVLPVIKAASETLVALVVCYGVIKSLPLLRDRVKLVRENSAVKELLHEARDAADAYQLSSEGWQSAVEQLGEQIRELTRRIEASNALLASAVLYITDLHTYVKVGGSTVPPIPEDLREAIEAVISKRNPTETLKDHHVLGQAVTDYTRKRKRKT